MRSLRRTRDGVPGRWGVAALGLVLMVLAPLAEAGPDRPALATLLAAANITVPPTPFPAPAFSVPDLAGGTVDLERLRGRVVLLYFWTTW